MQEFDGGVSAREGAIARPPGEEDTEDEGDAHDEDQEEGGKENKPENVPATEASTDAKDDLGAKKSGKGKAGKGAKKSAGVAEEEHVDVGKAKTGSRKGKVRLQ